MLADANESRDWRIYADFVQILIRQARKLCVNGSTTVDLDATVYALDPTTIDVCLALFSGGAVPLDQGCRQAAHPRSTCMDRGYVDFERHYALHQEAAFFVTHATRTLTKFQIH